MCQKFGSTYYSCSGLFTAGKNMNVVDLKAAAAGEVGLTFENISFIISTFIQGCSTYQIRYIFKNIKIKFSTKGRALQNVAEIRLLKSAEKLRPPLLLLLQS